MAEHRRAWRTSRNGTGILLVQVPVPVLVPVCIYNATVDARDGNERAQYDLGDSNQTRGGVDENTLGTKKRRSL